MNTIEYIGFLFKTKKGADAFRYYARQLPLITRRISKNEILIVIQGSDTAKRRAYKLAEHVSNKFNI